MSNDKMRERFEAWHETRRVNIISEADRITAEKIADGWSDSVVTSAESTYEAIEKITGNNSSFVPFQAGWQAALEHKPELKNMKCKDEDISNIHELRAEVAKYFLQTQRFSKVNDDLKERLEKSRIFQEKQQAEISEISIDKEILLRKIDKLLAGTGLQTIDDYIEARM